MRTVGENVYVSMEKEVEDEVSLGGDLTIKIATDFDIYNHVRQWGIVELSNPSIEKKYGFREGDKVYFHHFVPKTKDMKSYNRSNMEKIGDKEVYHAGIGFIYAYVRDGKVHAIGDWVFVEPIMQEIPQTDSGILLDYKEEEIPNIGYLVYANENTGASPGAKVLFSDDSEYEMHIEGRRLYRMRNDDLLAIMP